MQMGADLVAQHATKALMFCCLSADKVDRVHGKALHKCGKGSETCGGYWNPVEGHQKGWGTLETVADMWNVWKRVKIYQKCKQRQHCTSVLMTRTSPNLMARTRTRGRGRTLQMQHKQTHPQTNLGQ